MHGRSVVSAKLRFPRALVPSGFTYDACRGLLWVDLDSVIDELPVQRQECRIDPRRVQGGARKS
ncbi:hypothetical protein HMPREF0762_00582 [Slackia exigua ATCC 700122]|uniref:Uncharacterized protein n=1 Tax=Slackia exigua (strain ATCC 700122 / DSM 15923 / CIP 105133 / JCM 11022 / KCTC 5966 / S-7) TaxID=649764 RepID=D0WFI4_SLAES|nr:hypothetical protein HMPREF0762_00582 [Slackia exigua ATCC 700122]